VGFSPIGRLPKLDVSTGRLDVSTGRLEVSTGRLPGFSLIGNVFKGSTGSKSVGFSPIGRLPKLDVSTGRLDVSTGRLEVSTGRLPGLS
jgi:hypothetical protein